MRPGEVAVWNPGAFGDDDLAVKAQQTLDEHHLLESALDGLYEEFDKLSRKAPTAPVTPLALKAINEAISDSKALLGGDRYVDRISEFVAAGEAPETRDVLLVLAALRSALHRFELLWEPVWDQVLE
jgi:hypothetical protein